MRAAAKTRAAGTTGAILTLLLCAAATSALAAGQGTGQTTGSTDTAGTVSTTDGATNPVQLNQVQLGDVFAGQTINVVSGDPVVSRAAASGNVASTIGQDAGLSYTGDQRVAGNISGQAQGFVSGGAGQLLSVFASGNGSTATAGTCCGPTTGSATQALDAGSSVTSSSEVQLAGGAAALDETSTAVGNTQGWLSANGSVSTTTIQTSAGIVDAQGTATVVGAVDGPATYSATSVVNDVTGEGTTSDVSLTTRQTTAETSPSSATLTVQQDQGDTISAQTTATGNNLTQTVTDGSATLDAQQTNGGDVTADTAVGLGSWNSAVVGAYGVGNSILVSDTGPQATIAATQGNTGAVTASSVLTGGAGGATSLNATAVGNVVQGYACGTCGGGVGATIAQSNDGRVTAVGKVQGPGGGSVTGASTAVGNTVTLQVR